MHEEQALGNVHAHGESGLKRGLGLAANIRVQVAERHEFDQLGQVGQRHRQNAHQIRARAERGREDDLRDEFVIDRVKRIGGQGNLQRAIDAVHRYFVDDTKGAPPDLLSGGDQPCDVIDGREGTRIAEGQIRGEETRIELGAATRRREGRRSRVEDDLPGEEGVDEELLGQDHREGSFHVSGDHQPADIAQGSAGITLESDQHATIDQFLKQRIGGVRGGIGVDAEEAKDGALKEDVGLIDE